MQFDDPAVMRRECIERLGERSGEQFLATARRGFRLKRAADEASATGRCRLGGPALLEPGTRWPEAAAGRPLSLYAVLDTDALSDWLGDDLPTRPGLLNFFYLEPVLPTWRPCAVIPARPDRATVTTAPEQALTYPTIPVHAVPVTMLPDMWDANLMRLGYDESKYWGFAELLYETMNDFDSNTADQDCAFGWPDNSHGNGVLDGDDVQLLQIAGDPGIGWGFGNVATLYFLIPAQSFATGDYSKPTSLVMRD